jgi:malate synthase
MTELRPAAVVGREVPGIARVLTPDALDFLGRLAREFEPRRQEILAARRARAARLADGEQLDFLAETAEVRESAWQVAAAPADLNDRRVEITGPAEAKMTINALNSGAKVFMADFEDALSPTWANVIGGQVALQDAVRRTLEFQSPEGKEYRLGDSLATLVVRPRGWHLVERHLEVDGAPMSASLFDFCLYMFHNGAELLRRGSGPYFYLPKMQSHREARLWNDVFIWAQGQVNIPRGSIRATVLIETIWAAFEMNEILYELREHAAGLNAGRWDYIFSIIKAYSADPSRAVLPDRVQVTMAVPFMRAYSQLLVKTCHRRGGHAMGGMSAFIPNRHEPEVTANALAKVREDKEREAGDGFDGTWVAHPDLVPVAAEIFNGALGDKPNQKDRQRDDVHVIAADLTNFEVDGPVTDAGLMTNVSVGIRYIASWLAGVGAAALDNLMEDAATAEISRSQVWQWIKIGTFSRDKVLAAIEPWRSHDAEAAALFEQVALSDDFVEFLTVAAYPRLD